LLNESARAGFEFAGLKQRPQQQVRIEQEVQSLKTLIPLK
jgi:hypothetical protein